MSGPVRVVRLDEVEQHSSESSCWLVIHDQVLDVTKFLEQHPGGAEALLEYAGGDGTQAFEDVGHSEAAREEMKTFKVGDLHPDDRAAKRKAVELPHLDIVKWSLLGLAVAIIAGIVVKRYVL